MAVRQMVWPTTRRAGARRWPRSSRPAPGFRRAVRDHGRPARHHPPARSALHGSCPGPSRHGGGGQGSRRRRERDQARATNCTTNPCSAIAACGWASPIRKSTRCRRAPSWAVAKSEEGGQDSDPGDQSLGRHPEELDLMKVVIGQVASEVGQLSGEARIPGRHHDRAAARVARGDMPDRPTSSASAPTTSADGVWPQPRRFGVVP